MPGTTLAVDFGTTHTVAMLRMPGREPQLLLFDGLPLLASAVFAEPSGVLHVGADAERMAIVDPAGYEPNPKRRIDEVVVLLAGREIHVSDLIGAVLYRVAGEAYRLAGEVPGEVVLTYPASWGPTRRQVLLDASARAGLPPVRLVPEPVGAAAYYVSVLHRALPPDRLLLVFDFGGGTVDIALVGWGPDAAGGFPVVGVGGLDDVGGVDIDAAIGEHFGGGTADVWQRRQILRGAKETLSREERTQLRLPGEELTSTLTRTDLEWLVGPLVERAARAATGLLRERGVGPDRLAGVLLVGGSSRIPLVTDTLRRYLGVDPQLVDQPEVVVAQGALEVGAAPQPAVPAAIPAPAPSTAKQGRSTAFKVIVALVTVAVLGVLVCGGGITALVLYQGSDLKKLRVFPTAELRDFAKPWLDLVEGCQNLGDPVDPDPKRAEDRSIEWVTCDVRGLGEPKDATIEFRQYADLATRDAARAEWMSLSSQHEDLPGESGPISGARLLDDSHVYWDDQAKPVGALVIVWGGKPVEEMRAWWNKHKA